MQTMQPTLRNGRNIWDAINMPRSEYEKRIGILRKKMAEQAMDVLLAYGLGFNDYGNPCYLSNFVIRLPRGAMVVLGRHDVALFFEGASRGVPSAKKTTWIEDVRPCANISQECLKYLEEKALLPARVGFAGIHEWMPYDQWKTLTDALSGGTIVDAQKIISDMRAIKSDRELDQIRRAARIVKTVFEKMPGVFLPKKSERHLDATIIREARFGGAEDVRVLIGRLRPDGWTLRIPENQSFRAGDHFTIYVGLAYERYWAEAIRGFRMDGDTLSHPEMKAAGALYGELTQRLKPGKTIGRCTDDILAIIEKSEFDCLPDFGLGNGIGLSLNEGPELDRNVGDEIRAGMCLTLRLAVKDQLSGAAMIGHTLCFADAGVEVLT